MDAMGTPSFDLTMNLLPYTAVYLQNSMRQLEVDRLLLDSECHRNGFTNEYQGYFWTKARKCCHACVLQYLEDCDKKWKLDSHSKDVFELPSGQVEEFLDF